MTSEMRKGIYLNINKHTREFINILSYKGTKAKQVVIKHIVDNVPSVLIEYTKHGNPKPDTYDRADSLIIAKAGFVLTATAK